MNLFEITKKSPRPVNTLLTPTAAAVRGMAMMESATTPGQAVLADGTAPIRGFQTRDSKVGGPDLGDVIYPGRLELAFVAGEEGTYEHAEEVEAEGANFVSADGTVGVLAGTAINTPLSFVAGQFVKAASGQFVEFILVELPTPEIPGNVRLRARSVPGYVKA